MVTKIFSGQIREGGVGSLTNESYEVLYDDFLKYAYLNPQPSIDYSDDSYRTSVNNSNEIEQYFKLHDAISISYLNEIRSYIKRGDIIVDIGCGGGALLDLLKNYCSVTIAIEPNKNFQESLKERGHIVFDSIDQCKQQFSNKADFVVSNHVIEHVNQPDDFIKSIKQILKPGGISFVLTPNYNDILMKINFDTFAPFFFRKVHLLYLTVESLQLIVENLKMEFIKPVYFHEFGLANSLYWLKEGKPCGNMLMNGINSTADELWKTYLISTGQTKDFAVIFKKPENDFS
jgi:2-polyprenyl-3-methyl-5-hydroxy-6-metoxy-1,4-benzoquinol methylase